MAEQQANAELKSIQFKAVSVAQVLSYQAGDCTALMSLHGAASIGWGSSCSITEAVPMPTLCQQVTAFNRLRDDVAKLGTPSDTLELRHRVGQSSEKFRELAQVFKQRVARHPDKSSTAAQKLLRDFQVGLA